MLGDAFLAKVKGVASKSFMGASPPDPLGVTVFTWFALATLHNLHEILPCVFYESSYFQDLWSYEPFKVTTIKCFE